MTPVPVPLEFGKSGDGERGGEGVIYTCKATDWLRKKLHFDTDTGPTLQLTHIEIGSAMSTIFMTFPK